MAFQKVVRFARGVGSAARLRLAGLRRHISGADVFLSYKRMDGSAYLHGLDNALRSLHPPLECSFDQLGAEPGIKVPASLIREVVNSTVLVVIGSPESYDSTAIKQEIEAFQKSRRPIVPIRFDERIKDACWYAAVAGLAMPTERPEALLTGIPASLVISTIQKAVGSTTARWRRRQAIQVTVATLVLGIVGLGVTAFMALRASSLAAEARVAREMALRNLEDVKIDVRRLDDQRKRLQSVVDTEQVRVTLISFTEDADQKVLREHRAKLDKVLAECRDRVAAFEQVLQFLKGLPEDSVRVRLNISRSLLQQSPNENLRSEMLAGGRSLAKARVSDNRFDTVLDVFGSEAFASTERAELIRLWLGTAAVSPVHNEKQFLRDSDALSRMVFWDAEATVLCREVLKADLEPRVWYHKIWREMTESTIQLDTDPYYAQMYLSFALPKCLEVGEKRCYLEPISDFYDLLNLQIADDFPLKRYLLRNGPDRLPQEFRRSFGSVDLSKITDWVRANGTVIRFWTDAKLHDRILTAPASVIRAMIGRRWVREEDLNNTPFAGVVGHSFREMGCLKSKRATGC